MKARTSQLGLGLWSGLYLFGSIAFIAPLPSSSGAVMW